MPRSPVVFVTNNAAHDFSAAEEFGELVYLTEGQVSRFDVINIHRQVKAVLASATADDHLLITSLTIINVIASSILARRFGKLNLLIFDVKTKKYVSRTVVIGD